MRQLATRALWRLTTGVFAALLLSGFLGLSAWAALGDAAADHVLGQIDFSSKLCNRSAVLGAKPTASTLCHPSGVAISASQRVFVADSGNNRILSWPDAHTFADGQAADLVLGQPGFTSNSAAAGQTGLNAPSGLKVQSSTNESVWVADTGNSRVLRYSPPFSNGQAADLELGQFDFTGSFCDRSNSPIVIPSASNLCRPTGLVFDAAGLLYVADWGNNRVLQYVQPYTTGMAATGVFGQATFGLGICNRGSTTAAANTLCGPTAVEVANGRGELLVADQRNNRVVAYGRPFKDGQTAQAALGQPDLTSNLCNRSSSSSAAPAANTLCAPLALKLDTQARLYVSDAANNRIVVYERPYQLGGMNATVVLGQANFTSRLCNRSSNPGAAPTASSVCLPQGLGTADVNSIYLADSGNSRLLKFDTPIIFAHH